MSKRTSAGQSPAGFADNGKRYFLNSPLLAPTADSFIFNHRMLLQVTCRGYATAQFMQPEVATYTYHPFIAARTFIQPEPQYYAHHPGRFFYIRDDNTDRFFSAPYDPVRAELDKFSFAPGLSDIQWLAKKNGIEVKLRVTIPRDDIVELWTATVTNSSRKQRRISLYPYFPIGYSSWMNMAGTYDQNLRGIICYSKTPYQLMEDYFKNKDLKDLTYLLADIMPTSWQANQKSFEGQGGPTSPDDLKRPHLSRSDARFEIPAAVLQFSRTLAPGKSFQVNLAFGPAKDIPEIRRIRTRYLKKNVAEKVIKKVNALQTSRAGCIMIDTPDEVFNHFINHWLPRQINYQARSNRMTTDPQTRNYLQDAMGMTFLDPDLSRRMFRTALSRQQANGAMPEGILLIEGTELKYINRVPHRDHCIWTALALAVYLNETADTTFLHEKLPFADSTESASVYKHTCMGLDWLLKDRSSRGLSLIGQGDWCDPMNMAGYKGKGESAWLTEALAYVLRCWAPFCKSVGDKTLAARYRKSAGAINAALNKYMWDGSWYARGTSDSGKRFGIKRDKEGKIFLNAQSWAVLCAAPTGKRLEKCIAAVQKHLETPFGPMTLAPAYTEMREDIGRVTQKHPGVSENGSVYSHAALFYVFALYTARRTDHAFNVLRSLLPGPEIASVRRSRQLPLYLPTYYRGATFPATAGRSSHLPNTGTLSWYYRTVVEVLFGLRGCAEGLLVDPQLPKRFKRANVRRYFRGAVFDIRFRRSPTVSAPKVVLDGRELPHNLIPNPKHGAHHTVEVTLPR